MYFFSRNYDVNGNVRSGLNLTGTSAHGIADFPNHSSYKEHMMKP